MEGWPCRLLRGGVELGVVTHDPPEQGTISWNVGILEPSPEFEGIRLLFAHEEETFRQLAVIEDRAGYTVEAAQWQAQANLAQAEIMRLGVQMVRLDNGQVYEVAELHLIGLEVYWT